MIIIVVVAIALAAFAWHRHLTQKHYIEMIITAMAEDRLTVEAEGEGYVITIEGVEEDG